MRTKALKITSVLLAAIIALLAVPFTAAADGGDETPGEGVTGDCTWTLSGDGVLTVSGSGKMADYAAYGDPSPWGRDIRSVVIENGVTYIGARAFRGSGILTEATVANSVTSIGEDAFASCTALPAIELPDSVSQVGNEVFLGCKSLKSFRVPKSLSKLSAGMFQSSGLTSIDIPNTVTQIRTYVFDGCEDLSRVTFPNDPYRRCLVCSHAFARCTALTEVYITAGVNDISPTTFVDCTNLTRITVDENNAAYDSRNDCNAVIRKSDSQLVLGCQSTVIPNDVKIIGFQSFLQCTGLKSVTIPNGVTKIEDQAFSGCTGLTEIVIPDSVTTIENYAFSGCTSLTEAVLYGSATSMGELIFAGCTSLRRAVLPNDLKTISMGLFRYCESLTDVNIPDGVVTIKSGAFSGCRSLKEVTLPDSVTTLENGSFGSTGLERLFIGKNVTEIDYRALSRCVDLRCLVVEEQNPVYDSRQNCNAVVETKTDTIIIGCQTSTIPYGIKDIWAFTRCPKSLNIPSSIKAISDYMFSYCDGLETIVIPDAFTEIGYKAFSNCPNLKNIYIPPNVQEIPNRMCEYCPSLACILIPGFNTKLYMDSFQEIEDTVYYTPYNSHAFKFFDYTSPHDIWYVHTECSCGADFNANTVEVVPGVDPTPFAEGSTPGVRCKSCGRWYFEPSVLEKKEIIKRTGDINFDGTVNVRDTTSIQRHVGELNTLSDEQLLYSDTNGDGAVDINDATYLQMYLAEYDVNLVKYQAPSELS